MILSHSQVNYNSGQLIKLMALFMLVNYLYSIYCWDWYLSPLQYRLHIWLYTNGKLAGLVSTYPSLKHKLLTTWTAYLSLCFTKTKTVMPSVLAYNHVKTARPSTLYKTANVQTIFWNSFTFNLANTIGTGLLCNRSLLISQHT